MKLIYIVLLIEIAIFQLTIPVDGSKGQEKVDAITDEDYREDIDEMYNEGTLSDLNDVLAAIEGEDVTEETDCNKVKRDFRREGYADGREIKREYYDVIKEIYAGYKEETS